MLLVNRHSLFHFIIIPFLLLALTLVGCKEKKFKDKEIIRSVKTLIVTPASTSGTRQLSGVVKPTDESDLSFQVGGTVEMVEVKLGDTVKKGQLLAAIDPRDFELKLLSAQAALVSAKTNVTNTLVDLERKKKLLEHDFASKAEYDKAKSIYEMALSKEKIEISIEEERKRDLDRTKLLSPFDGKISQRLIEPHQETQPGRVVFKLQSEVGLKIEVLVPESLIRDLKPKQSVKVEFPTMKNLQLEAVVREIGAQSNVGNAFPVTFDLMETTADLRAGMSAQVIFDSHIEGKDNVYLIPISAVDTRPQLIQQRKDMPDVGEKIVSIFLFIKDGSKVKRQDVTIRAIQGNLIEVVKGLKEGDVLVTAGVPFLEDGQAVTQWKQKYRSPETDR